MALRYPDTARNSGPIKSAEQLAVEAGIAHRGRAGQLQFRTRMSPALINLCEKQQYQCIYCECALTSQNATLDHVLPISRGGSVSDPANLVASCFSCNNEKGDRLLHSEWTPPYLRGPSAQHVQARLL
jgi:5-methylcytosine-specific restriction endonuclease McrA